MRRNERSAFLCRAIHICGYRLPVPVQLLGSVGLVVDVDGDRLPLFEAEQRAGKLAVVSRHGNDAVGGEFNGFYCDGERVVGLLDWDCDHSLALCRQRQAQLRRHQQCASCRRACAAQKIPASGLHAQLAASGHGKSLHAC